LGGNQRKRRGREEKRREEKRREEKRREEGESRETTRLFRFDSKRFESETQTTTGNPIQSNPTQPKPKQKPMDPKKNIRTNSLKQRVARIEQTLGVFTANTSNTLAELERRTKQLEDQRVSKRHLIDWWIHPM